MYFNYDYVLTNHGDKNFGGKRSSTKYIIIHYTGNVKDTAENNAKYFFNGDRRAGANFFVDGKGVWASTPEEYTAYGAGVLHNRKYAKLWGICTNHNAINIEIACDAGNSLPTAGAVTNTVELTKSLMAKYGIPESNVVRHKTVAGKRCPAYWWDDTKWQNEFKSRLSGGEAQNVSPAPIPKPNVQPKPQPKHVNHVDGVWGEATTKALQRYLGTVVDGIISHQLVSSEKLLISRFGHTSDLITLEKAHYVSRHYRKSSVLLLMDFLERIPSKLYRDGLVLLLMVFAERTQQLHYRDSLNQRECSRINRRLYEPRCTCLERDSFSLHFI